MTCIIPLYIAFSAFLATVLPSYRQNRRQIQIVNAFLIGKSIMESNTLAANVIIKQLLKKVWLNTRGEYMKESNIHADNAESNFLRREVLVDTNGAHIKVS